METGIVRGGPEARYPARLGETLECRAGAARDLFLADGGRRRRRDSDTLDLDHVLRLLLSGHRVQAGAGRQRRGLAARLLLDQEIVLHR